MLLNQWMECGTLILNSIQAGFCILHVECRAPKIQCFRLLFSCQWMSVATVGHGDMVGHGTQRSGL